NGSTKAVPRSGTSVMSDSWIAWNPRIDEPSNIWPSVENAAPTIAAGTEKCGIWPGRSQNRTSLRLTSAAAMNARTSSGLLIIGCASSGVATKWADGNARGAWLPGRVPRVSVVLHRSLGWLGEHARGHGLMARGTTGRIGRPRAPDTGTGIARRAWAASARAPRGLGRLLAHLGGVLRLPPARDARGVRRGEPRARHASRLDARAPSVRPSGTPPRGRSGQVPRPGARGGPGPCPRAHGPAVPRDPRCRVGLRGSRPARPLRRDRHHTSLSAVPSAGAVHSSEKR